MIRDCGTFYRGLKKEGNKRWNVLQKYDWRTWAEAGMRAACAALAVAGLRDAAAAAAAAV